MRNFSLFIKVLISNFSIKVYSKYFNHNFLVCVLNIMYLLLTSPIYSLSNSDGELDKTFELKCIVIFT